MIGRTENGQEKIVVCSELEELVGKFPVNDYDEFKIVTQNGYTERDLFGWGSFDRLINNVEEKIGNHGG